MSWGGDRYALLLLHLKMRLAKPAQMVSDSPRSMIKGVFFLKRKITFNHSGSGAGTLCCQTPGDSGFLFSPLQNKDRRG